MTFIVYAALTGATFLFPLVLQVVSGYSPLASGLALVPLTVIMLALSARSGQLAAQIGPRLQLSAGPFITGVGLAMLTFSTSGPSYVIYVLPAMAGITGPAYLNPDALAAGFRTAVLISGGLCAAGGLLAAVTITNPRKDPGTAAAPAPEECLHCGLDAPPLTTSVSQAAGP